MIFFIEQKVVCSVIPPNVLDCFRDGPLIMMQVQVMPVIFEVEYDCFQWQIIFLDVLPKYKNTLKFVRGSNRESYHFLELFSYLNLGREKYVMERNYFFQSAHWNVSLILFQRKVSTHHLEKSISTRTIHIVLGLEYKFVWWFPVVVLPVALSSSW